MKSFVLLGGLVVLFHMHIVPGSLKVMSLLEVFGSPQWTNRYINGCDEATCLLIVMPISLILQI